MTRRARYLGGAICLTLCTIMLMPLLASVLASLKSPEEAAAVPPSYLPSGLSLHSYQRLWEFQAGLPTYLANSFIVAFLTIAVRPAPDVPVAGGNWFIRRSKAAGDARFSGSALGRGQ